MKIHATLMHASYAAFVVLALFGSYTSGVIINPTVIAQGLGKSVEIHCNQRYEVYPAQWNGYNTTTFASFPIYYLNSSTSTSERYQTDLFSIRENIPSRSYVLTIKNITKEVSTFYECSADETPMNASVFGVDKIICPMSGMEYIEGTVVPLYCSVDYYRFRNLSAFTDTPSLTYHDYAGYGIGNSSIFTYHSNGVTVSYETNMTLVAAKHDGLPVSCLLSFPNSISYTDSCNTTYYVTHGVSKINSSIEQNSYVAYNGDVINCTANGRPTPSITWTDMNGKQVSSTYELTVTSDMINAPQPVRYSCHANNVVNSQTYSADRTFTFYAYNGSIKGLSTSPHWAMFLIVCLYFFCSS